MKRSLVAFTVFWAIISASAPVAAESDEIAELRNMIEAMRSDYERRIQSLEQRLAIAEQSAQGPGETASGSSADAVFPGTSASRSSVTAGNAFNPQTSVILNGNYYHDDVGGEGAGIQGEALQASQAGHGHEEAGHSHASTSSGFNFSEAELAPATPRRDR